MSETLEIRDVHAERGGAAVLRGVTLSVAPGEVCAVMGMSGSGKTTLLRVIAALEPFTAGSVSMGAVALRPGRIPPERQLAALRGRVGMVFQAHALFEHLTALENVTLAPLHSRVHAREWSRGGAEAAAMELLASLGVSARAHAYPRQISGGEAQRVAIARALVQGPGLLLMDEPTSALDPARRNALGDTVRGLAGEGRAIVLATHDVEFALAHADRVAVLSQGVVVEAGPARAVLTRPAAAATRELLAQDPGAVPLI